MSRTRLAALAGELASRWSGAGSWRARIAALPGLRSLVPTGVARPDASYGFHLDRCLVVDEGRLLVSGWTWDAIGPVRSVSLEGPDGPLTPILPGAVRTARPDLGPALPGLRCAEGDRPGFTALVETPTAPERLAAGRVRVHFPGAGVRSFRLPEAIRDPWRVLRILEESIPDPSAWTRDLMMGHLAPALGAAHARAAAVTRVAETVEFGTRPRDPLATLVVPLFRRLDLLESQLAQLVLDPDRDRLELVLVLDSPEQRDELLALALAAYSIYRFPFQVRIMERNSGYGAACNRGAEGTRGATLILLNSDAVPIVPGWASRLATLLGSDRSLGAVGPKLLRDDRTIQHAGLGFVRFRVERLASMPEIWTPRAFFKGHPRHAPAATVARAVPAVTGACLAISRARFEELGGYDLRFVQGDCEDTDLCLRLRERGLEIRYEPGIELYHFEGASYPSERRRLLGPLNRILHHLRWADRIEELMRPEGPWASSDPGPLPAD